MKKEFTEEWDGTFYHGWNVLTILVPFISAGFYI
jgi:hypothetical protein